MGRTRCCPAAAALHAFFAPVWLPSLAAALFAGVLFAAAPAGAAVFINELLPNPDGDDTGNEWVEIYNSGPGSVDMTGWAIDDAATIDNVSVRARIPEDLDATCSTNPVIGPGEFRIVKGVTAAPWLNNSGDDVYLISDRTLTPNVVHFVQYASAPSGMAWACIPNGTSNFDWRAITKCASNGGTGDVVPPGDIVDLVAVAGEFPGEVRLTWTAAGDDGFTGQAADYLIRVSDVPINAGNFDASSDIERWLNAPLPLAGGAAETLFVFGMDPDSTFYFSIKTQDEVPNTSNVSNSPSTMPKAGTLPNTNLGLMPYFGNLHSHTGYSDGVQTPADAYNYARNLAQTPLDFFAVTEHNHSGAGMSLANWAPLKAQAAAANDDGNFVAIFGQEWGFAANGHVNIYEAPTLFGWEPANYDVFVAEGDYNSLYNAIVANPPPSYPIVAEWAHPSTSNFANMLLTANALASVHLMALVNGPANSVSTTESDIGNTGYDDEFQTALQKGFRVSPTADQDNHSANWGASSESRTAVLAASLTKSNLLNAMAARRTYATQDHNVVVNFSADGFPMGEAFEADSGVTIAVEVVDPDLGDAVIGIDLFRGITGGASATRVAFNSNSPRFYWRELDVPSAGTEVHYYLRIRMADNASVWTGPVYVTYEEPVPVAVELVPRSGLLSLATRPNPSAGRVTARFSLPGDEPSVSLAVYDLSGRRVRQLVDGPLGAGAHQIDWDGRAEDGSRPAAGLYFMRLQARDAVVTDKLMLMR
jgi:hypothetical protein